MTTFYISGKANVDEDRVDSINRYLNMLGHTNYYNWTKEKVKKPYSENMEKNAIIAKKMIDAARFCDIFILLYHKKALGAWVELGAALTNTSHKIFIISAERESIFYTMPNIQQMETFEQFFKLRNLT